MHVSELNTTATIEPYMWFTLNTQREMIYNASKPITGGSTSFKVASDSIYTMSLLISSFDFNHLKNSPDLDDSYLTDYDKYMKSDLCPF